MRHKLLKFLVVIGLIGMGLGCFGGVKKTGKVTGYKNGRVLTKSGSYQVGELPPLWQRFKLGKALVAFRNDPLQSTISTDSFCDQAYNDSSLKNLTRHLFAGLHDLKVIQEKPFMLDDRGALRTLIKAKLDGLSVMVDIVIVKKNWCLFDFYLVSAPEKYLEASKAFETFFEGFSYKGGV